jgi:hypothetical protein
MADFSPIGQQRHVVSVLPTILAQRGAIRFQDDRVSLRFNYA